MTNPQQQLMSSMGEPGHVSLNDEQNLNSNMQFSPAQVSSHATNTTYMPQMYSNPSPITQMGYPSQVVYPGTMGGYPNLIGPGSTPSVSSSDCTNAFITNNSSMPTHTFGISGVPTMMGTNTNNTFASTTGNKSRPQQIGVNVEECKTKSTYTARSTPSGNQVARISADSKNTHSDLAPVVSLPQTDVSFDTNGTNSIAISPAPMPPLPPNTTTAMQVQVAAAAAAAAAAPPKGYHGPKSGKKENSDVIELDGSQNAINSNCKKGPKRRSGAELSPEEKQKLNRDRNREHARSTRLRKKAYVNKLKEMVDILHAERSEEARKRRVEVQHLAEVQRVRRSVIKRFLQFHAGDEADRRNWVKILEDDFFIKQPVTPYRSFRRSEIERSTGIEYRISKGVDAVMGDAASMAVMVESIGSRSTRWMQIKRDDMLNRDELKRSSDLQQLMPHNIVQQSNPQQHVSGISSSESSSGNRSGEEEEKEKSSISNKQLNPSSNQANSSNEFHDYHAKPLPDPKLDSGGSSGRESSTNSGNETDIKATTKRVITDSSSADDEKSSMNPAKKRKLEPLPDIPPKIETSCQDDKLQRDEAEVINLGYLQKDQSTTNQESLQNDESTINQETPIEDEVIAVTSVGNNEEATGFLNPISAAKYPNLPSNIARSGGISHNIRSISGSCSSNQMKSRLSLAPAISLPPFVGIGKRATRISEVRATVTNTSSSSDGQDTGDILATTLKGERNESDTSSGSTNITSVIVNDAASSNSSINQIQAYYHVNEDDMLLTDDVLMCPFIFRSQDAVQCGALAECVMPGMVRASFSLRNKLQSLEMVYDAMGFMQQLERASGSEGIAQIIPNSLEIAFQPALEEARVITEAKPPFKIVSVNEKWCQITKYSQVECERKELMTLLNGNMRADFDTLKRTGKPDYDFNKISRGQAACSTNLYCNKYGQDFVAFMSSYPLTDSKDNITHLVHAINELPEPAMVEFAEALSHCPHSISVQEH